MPVDIRQSNATVTVDLTTNNDVTIDASSIVLLEDDAHATADAGIQMLAVRKAAPADLSGADGDYEPLQLDNGRLWTSGIITAQVPGTGATNLGKAIDSAVGATDTGVAMLAKYEGDVVHLTTADGDYDVLRLSDLGALQIAPEQHHTLDSMNVTTNWAALSNDTTNLATTKKHVLGTDALTFDKEDGGDNTVFAAIAKTIAAVDLGEVSMHDLIQTACYIPDLSDVAYVFARVGTDSSHYNEWRISDIDLTAATFETLIFNVGDVNYAGVTGNGWNPSAITYIVVGVAFDAETDALAGIVFDELSFHTNQHTSAELNAEVSSSVSSANVNLQKIAGSVTDKGAGNVSNGSQRIVVATDDVNLAAIKTAVELIDDPVAVLGTATYTETTTKGNVIGVVRNDALATLANTDNEIAPLQVNASGALYTVLSAGAAVVGEVTIGAATGAAGDLAKIEDAQHASADVGVMSLAVRNDALAALGGTDGDYVPFQTCEDGGLWTRPSAGPKGGCKMFTSVDLDESEEDPAAGPVTIYGIYAYNLTAAPLWLQMWNTNTVTVGTTAPTNNFMIPANADSDGAGVVIPIPVCGLAYSTALTVAITTGSGTDNGAPGAGDAGIVILYQD